MNGAKERSNVLALTGTKSIQILNLAVRKNTSVLVHGPG